MSAQCIIMISLFSISLRCRLMRMQMHSNSFIHAHCITSDDRDRLSIDLLSIKTSYAPKRPIDTCLFTKETRSTNLEKLYAAATLQVPNTKETYNMQI